MLMKILKNLLQEKINDIDSGNSNISETEQLELIKTLQKLSFSRLSKLQAADYIGVSRATFDNYIKKGLLPKGKRTRGWKELFWNKSDLYKYPNEK